MNNKERILDVKNLKVYFDVDKRKFAKKDRRVVKAVDNIDLHIDKAEILSLVGESGSGKTTTGKAILHLIKETEGKIEFNGKLLGHTKEDLREFRLKAQMIYQDPYQSLNPRMRIFDIIAEPLEVNHLCKSKDEKEAKVKEALELAGLIPAEDFYYRYPYELSGGQRQRVVIASSIIMDPEFIVADEPISMLDASIRTGILKLMLELRDRLKVSYLFITHDLSLAWLISDRIAIMYLGKIMEIGTADQIIKHGVHPYTKALTAIMPIPGVNRDKKRVVLEGETPNASADIKGCKFCGRCPEAMEICKTHEPEFKELEPGHCIMCHKY